MTATATIISVRTRSYADYGRRSCHNGAADSYGDHNQRKNSFFLKNGNFLRLKNIELSYSLPAKWIRKVAMNECRVYVNANNLITWDKLDGLCDPESEGSNRYPIMKTVNFGVNIKF